MERRREHLDLKEQHNSGAAWVRGGLGRFRPRSVYPLPVRSGLLVGGRWPSEQREVGGGPVPPAVEVSPPADEQGRRQTTASRRPPRGVGRGAASAVRRAAGGEPGGGSVLAASAVLPPVGCCGDPTGPRHAARTAQGASEAARRGRGRAPGRRPCGRRRGLPWSGPAGPPAAVARPACAASATAQCPSGQRGTAP